MGAAHWVAQWARWKTISRRVRSAGRERGEGAPEGEGTPEGRGGWHTLLDAVLLGALLGALGGRHALDALLKVVLRRRALLGVPALCEETIMPSVSIGSENGDNVRRVV